VLQLPREMDPRIGTEFAGHRIEGVIGRGGASVVYLAEHLRLGRKVALKVLAPHLADDEAFRERFIRESRIAAGLDHPNVVTVYDAGEIDGNLYISMRYVEGSDLGRLLGSEGALEPLRTVSILGQIASALDAAHAQGLVHRDVKPANMLVEAASDVPDFDRAYLSDFGISKRTTSREGLTRTGQFVGTVDYVAPEQITGEPVDGRTDVYSLGCVLFECLSGHVPFPGESGVATIYSHLHDTPPSLEGFGASETGLNRVVARALAKTRADRFDTCGAVIEAVRSELAATARTVAPVEAMGGDDRAGAHRSTSRSGRPRRRFAALAAGAIAIVTIVVAVALAIGGADSDPGGGGDGETRSLSPEPTGPTTDGGGESPSFIWSKAYETERSGLGGAAIIDAVVTDTEVVVAVGHATPGGPASGLDDAAVWRSDDGLQWQRIGQDSLGQDGDQRMIAITEFNGLLVAGGWSGADAAVWTSSDGGESWTRSDAPGLEGLGSQRIRDFVTAGSELVAVGSSGLPDQEDAAAWVSVNGLEWEPMVPSAFVAPGQQELFAAREIGDRLVAVGFTNELGDIDAAAWVFEVGTWTRVPPESLAAPVGHQVMLDVAGGVGDLPLVAVGCEDPDYRCDTDLATQSDAVVWTSEDGVTWERVPAEGGRLAGEGEQAMRALVNYRGDFVAVGSSGGALGDIDGGVWTSADGVTWRAPTQASPSVTALGGPGDQGLRALVVYSRHGITLFGFGVTNDGESDNARVWGATVLAD